MTALEIEPRPINLLSLDGGGIRGLSSLVILKRIMYSIERRLGLEYNSLLPCDYFDLIAGTSTGGLIAIMLGPLRMDVDSCISKYLVLVQKIFPAENIVTKALGKYTKSLVGAARFDAEVLEGCVKEIVGSSLHAKGPETKLDFEASRRTGEPRCKVFVCATDKDTKGRFRLRTYDSDEPGTQCTIWQACRATTAAPTFFDFVQFGEPIAARYVDGGLGTNNPIRALIDEASRIWSKHSDQLKIGAVVSIGTGLKPVKSIGKNIAAVGIALSEIATDTDKIAADFEAELENLGPKFPNMNYFRFSVPGIGDTSLEEWKKFRKINQVTNEYLTQQRKHVERCVTSILTHSESGSSTSTQFLSEIPVSASQVYGRDSELQEIHDYLSPKKSGQKIAVLWGLPGYGKTQLAIHYLSMHKSAYTHIVWADASSFGAMKDSILNVVRQVNNLRSPTINDTTALSVFKEFFVKLGTGRWLMVMDSYDTDSFDIRNFLPSPHVCSGSILITSVRSKIAFNLNARGIEIKGLDGDAGYDMLRHYLGDRAPDESNSWQIESIVQGFEGMPLAIEITAALLSTKNLVLHDVIKDYVERVLVHKPRPLQWSYDKHRSIEEILELIIDAIKDDETHAAKLLIMSCMMGPIDIPLIAFEGFRSLDTTSTALLNGPSRLNLATTDLGSACSTWLRVNQGVTHDIMVSFNQLEELGLAKAKRNPSGRVVSFSIHSLIRTLSLRRLKSNEKRELMVLLAQSVCDSLGHENLSWIKSNRCVQLVRTVLEHLREVVNEVELSMPDNKDFDHYKRMCARCGAFFMDNGRFSDAQDAYELANQYDFLGRQAGSVLSKSSIASLQDFALACRSNGNLDQAAEIFQHIYDESLNAYGVDDDATIEAAEWLKKLRIQLSKRASNETSASTNYSTPKGPPHSLSHHRGEAPAQSAPGGVTSFLDNGAINAYNPEQIYEILELAKENHAIGRNDFDAIRSFKAASRYFRTIGHSRQHEAWFIRAWDAYSAAQDSGHERDINSNMVYELLVFYFEDPPASDTLRILIQTAAFQAIRLGHENVLRVLISNDISPTIIDNNGRNLLHHASLSDRASLLSVCDLIELNVDFGALDNHGLTPIGLSFHQTSFKSLRKLVLFLMCGAKMPTHYEKQWQLMLHGLIQQWRHRTGVNEKRSVLSLFRHEALQEEFMSLSIKSWWDVHWRDVESPSGSWTCCDPQHVILLVSIAHDDVHGLERLLELQNKLRPRVEPRVRDLLREAAGLGNCQMVELLWQVGFPEYLSSIKVHIPLLVTLAECDLESTLLLMDNNAQLPFEKFNPGMLEKSIRNKADQWMYSLSQASYLDLSEIAELKRMLLYQSSFLRSFLQLLENLAARSRVRRSADAESLRRRYYNDKDSNLFQNQSMASASASAPIQRFSPFSFKRYIRRRQGAQTMQHKSDAVRYEPRKELRERFNASAPSRSSTELSHRIEHVSDYMSTVL